MMRELILAAGLLAPMVTAAEGMLTILEGDALVYRATGRLHAAEGLKLAAGDIVETDKATFVQLELPDAAVAQFGPETRVWFNTAGGRKAERWLYAMQGWIKLTGGKQEVVSVRTPVLDMNVGPSVVVVMHTTPVESMLFVERGEVKVSERHAQGTPAVVALKAGDHYRRKVNAKGAVNPGGMQAFVQDMPRAFRDSLPLRAERYRDQQVKPREAPAFAYADVEDWLKAEPGVRKPLMQRWRSKAREAPFRAALISNLNAHPEWDPILFPEKYLPKPASAPRVASAPAR